MVGLIFSQEVWLQTSHVHKAMRGQHLRNYKKFSVSHRGSTAEASKGEAKQAGRTLKGVEEQTDFELVPQKVLKVFKQEQSVIKSRLQKGSSG